MAGILERFGDIMKANINSMLDGFEDPSKMIDQTLRDLNESLAKVRKETAAVMAEETRNKRIVDGINADIKRYEDTAKKALSAGNEGDARKMLEKKAEATARLESAQKTYDIAKANSKKMRDMHDKLVSDISELNGRREQIKAKVAMAEAQQKINKATQGINTNASIAAFEKYEAKADKMLDEASAMSSLNMDESTDEAQDIIDKYNASSNPAIDDELAKLKASMGLE